MKKTALALMMTALCDMAIAAAPEPMTMPHGASPAAPSMAGSAKTTPATPVVIAPAAQTDAAAITATCKDGTTFSGASKRGACSGHKGVKSWAGTMAVTDAKAESKQESKQESKERGQRVSAPLPTAAAGGGAGKVWVNEKSNTYHCQTDRYYGRTKTGAYMTEAEAKVKGAHADHGKACV